MKVVFGALLLCAAVVSGQERARFGTCTFPGVDLEPIVDDLLKRLPESYNLADAVDRDVLPGLRVGNTTLVGLSKLKVHGAPRLFCRRGKAMLEISTHGFARFSAPWRHCGGKSGNVSTASPYVTLNMLFEVNDATGALVTVDVWLTWLEGTFSMLEGVDRAVDMGVSIVLTKLLPAVVRDFWVEALAWNTRSILKQITSP
uniref:Putative conserved secreted protein n=1 Tax=Amblyomma tuberculatum TaxID=48802 RepID=A0A6M2E697_9ACAR